jgi:hypothetical protein
MSPTLIRSFAPLVMIVMGLEMRAVHVSQESTLLLQEVHFVVHVVYTPGKIRKHSPPASLSKGASTENLKTVVISTHERVKYHARKVTFVLVLPLTMRHKMYGQGTNVYVAPSRILRVRRRASRAGLDVTMNRMARRHALPPN